MIKINSSRFAVVGSRSLSSAFAPVVCRVCSALVRRGGSIVVGCSRGADELVLLSSFTASFVSSVKCFAAFDVDGSGACGVSAVATVSAFATAGGSVSWLSGGGLSVPVRGRLSCRTFNVISSASAGVVGFVVQDSKGTISALSLAAARGLPVVAFAAGSFELPLIGSGKWVRCNRSGIWSSAWSWVAAPVLL
jgi:hypothetical protein